MAGAAPPPLPRTFFNRPTLVVARELLGKRLIRIEGQETTGGWIVEAEAYIGQSDQACHARAGRTPRTAVMFGPPGHAYVYFTYGMHWMLNAVTEQEGYPAAVLLRAIRPAWGLDRIRERRAGRPEKAWTNGPGKLCQALAIHGDHNGLDLCSASGELFIADGSPVPDARVTITPRVGLNNVPEPWKSLPWRFSVEKEK